MIAFHPPHPRWHDSTPPTQARHPRHPQLIVQIAPHSSDSQNTHSFSAGSIFSFFSFLMNFFFSVTTYLHTLTT